MVDIKTLKSKGERGFLDGHFLIAMPGMADTNFARAVVYICAHSDQGAMGFVINQPQQMTFVDILLHLKVIGDEDAIRLPDAARSMPIQRGGPVESGRGFVLHSDDYLTQSSIPVSEDICLTATVDIIRAMSRGKGPARAALMLGYAGWGAGQIENEIANNGWLTCPADETLIFDRMLDGKYNRALALMGVNPAMLSMQVGHG
ncbi:putative transcriptional regulator [Rhizobium sp. SG_E_25_P2]|jgi:putative transcriptional regulator|uniref:YqgE/AlgH family protein n=1 Tax=Rhizobium sp. SG_E_25_P2 TaxID=2879942 RepID=UPI00247583B1|nr:YqgE/AlgH family protein [Rhizobium sp. SG_E_25_P2]MDH6266630.1 putative transcriptional regulator [Rhizobium sp. SG_E_25_P2]